MHFSSRRVLAIVALLFLIRTASAHPEPLSAVHRQRYFMGTMFEIIAYQDARADAERAIQAAFVEIGRLDQVLSHFKPDSDLSNLVREARKGFVAVEPSLYEVLQQSIIFSQRSGGKFDVTIAPLLRTWQTAHAQGHRPSEAAIDAARRCVGYQKIELAAPGRIRFASDCVEIDLGGIGKGYAVDRAIAVLTAAGVQHALVNAGSSSIAAIGAPPGRRGWPVRLGASVSGRTTLLLRDASISTSRQSFLPFRSEAGLFGEILDPQSGAPAGSRLAVSVVAASAAVSDALSTTLLMLSRGEATTLLEQFGDVSALWMSADGELQSSYRSSQLLLSDSD